jgi:hypothetical protein
MAYFIILPAFIVWLIVGAIALLVIRANGRLSHSFPYAWRFYLWSTIGFVIANVLLVIVVAGGAALLEPGSEERTFGRDAVQLMVGLGGIVGPIPASVIGWLGGGLLGAFRSFRKRPQTVV